jgi:glycosyltransferase involved in cell wall biosynthesis
VVGDGPGREDLLADLKRLDIEEATELTGAVAPEAVPALLQRMHVAVSTTSSASGFYFSPLKVFEYMAAGLPVVASPVGQLSSILQDGLTGFFAPPGDPEALAEVFDRLRQDPELRQRVGAAARSEALAHHTWDARICAVFDKVGLPLG